MGGGVGWALGAKAGIMTAFFAMVIGTAAGVYMGKRFADRIET